MESKARLAICLLISWMTTLITTGMLVMLVAGINHGDWKLIGFSLFLGPPFGLLAYLGIVTTYEVFRDL